MARLTLIKLQGNKRAHLKYHNKLNLVDLNGIVTLGKLVEVNRLDRKNASPRLTNLRLEIMGVLCPRIREPLFEAVVPCL